MTRRLGFRTIGPLCILASLGAVAASAAGAQLAEKSMETSRDDETKAPRLYRVIVPVPDIDRAAEFYGELLGAGGARISGGRHYFDCGGVVLALYSPAGDGDDAEPKPLPDHLYFAVADLDATFERARRVGGLSAETGDGGLPMGKIAERPWGERSFYLRDPFGTPLCFVDETTLFTGR